MTAVIDEKIVDDLVGSQDESKTEEPIPCGQDNCDNKADYKIQVHCCGSVSFICSDCLIDMKTYKGYVQCTKCGMPHASTKCWQVIGKVS